MGGGVAPAGAPPLAPRSEVGAGIEAPNTGSGGYGATRGFNGRTGTMLVLLAMAAAASFGSVLWMQMRSAHSLRPR